MPIAKITNLPNYCNGKLYKRWDNVSTLYSDGALIASRTDKNGQVIQLLITNSGKKRQLFTDNSEVIDEIDVNGIKRSFIYQKQSDGTTTGTMVIPKETPEEKKPLIVFARWISENLNPLRAELVLNQNHHASQITIAEKIAKNTVNKRYKDNVERVILENFDTSLHGALPRKVTLETTSGESKVFDGTIDDTKTYVRQLDLTNGNPSIEHMRIIV